MSSGENGGPANDLKWFLLILLGLWFLWFLSGGNNSPTKDDPFIKPPAPLDTGETYGPGDF